MQRGVAMKTYTFLCVRADGTRPTLEVASVEDHAAARRVAAGILESHDTCAQVEVWDEDDLLFTVTVADPVSELVCPRTSPDV
jgi:hypothetical protein